MLLNLSRFQFSSMATTGKGSPFSFIHSNHELYFFIVFSSLSTFTIYIYISFLFFRSFLSSFYFYFWPMYSLNMFMTHTKRILRLRLRFVSGCYKFCYTSHTTRAFQKVINARFCNSFLRFDLSRITQTSSDFRKALNGRVIR